jgi:IclR family acetate operon transcriptional repressor
MESHHELRRTYTDIGVPIALPLGAPGKAILSVLPLDRQERYLAGPIEAVTPRTVTDPDALRAELARTRACGWAGSNAERTSGIRAVAAPVFDHTGTVIGALGVSVPAVRMDDARAEELGRRVTRAAWQISEGLGATTAAVEAAVERAGGR